MNSMTKIDYIVWIDLSVISDVNNEGLIISTVVCEKGRISLYHSSLKY